MGNLVTNMITASGPEPELKRLIEMMTAASMPAGTQSRPMRQPERLVGMTGEGSTGVPAPWDRN